MVFKELHYLDIESLPRRKQVLLLVLFIKQIYHPIYNACCMLQVLIQNVEDGRNHIACTGLMRTISSDSSFDCRNSSSRILRQIIQPSQECGMSPTNNVVISRGAN